MPTRRLARTLLADLFFFGFFHGLMSLGAFLLLGDARPFLTALVLLAPFYGMTALRLKVNNLPLFLLGHLLLCAVPVFFGADRQMQGLLFLFLVIGMLYSLIVRLRGDWYPDFVSTAVLVLLNTILALVMDYFGLRQPGRVLFFWSFVMVAAGMICRQTVSVDASLAILAGSARQPMETTLRYSNFILAAFLLPVGLVGLVAAFLPLDQLGRMLVEGFFALLRFLTALLTRLLSLLPGGGEQAPPEEPPAQPPPDLLGMLPEAQESPLWLQILEQIFIVIVWVAIGAALLYAAVKGLRAIYRQFYKSKRTAGGEEREYIGPELRLESLWGKLRRARRVFPAFGESEEERVRRRYYRKIRRHIRRGIGVRPADTAGDIERRLKEKEDVGSLTKEYNRARYRIKPKKKK